MAELLSCFRCGAWPCSCSDGVAIVHGDCVEVLAELAAESVTAIVCDPPYGLEFMGKEWDKLGAHAEARKQRAAEVTEKGKAHSTSAGPYLAAGVNGYGRDGRAMQAWHERWAAAALRVCKPGSPLLAFGGTRTYHRLISAIEDTGWEVRDCLSWIYGQGFPKSLDVSKAIDKAAGAEREVVVSKWAERYPNGPKGSSCQLSQKGQPSTRTGVPLDSLPATALAKQWEGWGTALKPAWEPICLAMKPLGGTYAQNAERHGVAGLNVDGCRVEGTKPQVTQGVNSQGSGYKVATHRQISGPPSEGRWPANVTHDGSAEVLAGFPESTSTGGKGEVSQRSALAGTVYGDYAGDRLGRNAEGLGDTGSAARFFYTAKAGTAERGEGNTHPTVKPLALMSWLCKLVSMPGYAGTLLDPFCGSGSTLLAASRWFDRVIGIDADRQTCEIAAGRLEQSGGLFSNVKARRSDGGRKRSGRRA